MQMEDAESLFRLHSDDPEALQFIAWHPTHVAEVVVALLKLGQTFRKGQDVLWAIRVRDELDFVGLIHLANIHDTESDVHFFIARPYWGRGIVPEALAAVVAFAKERLCLSRVRGWCDVDNVRSARVFEKVGFRDLGMAQSTAMRVARTFALEL